MSGFTHFGRVNYVFEVTFIYWYVTLRLLLYIGITNNTKKKKNISLFIEVRKSKRTILKGRNQINPKH